MVNYYREIKKCVLACNIFSILLVGVWQTRFIRNEHQPVKMHLSELQTEQSRLSNIAIKKRSSVNITYCI